MKFFFLRTIVQKRFVFELCLVFFPTIVHSLTATGSSLASSLRFASLAIAILIQAQQDYSEHFKHLLWTIYGHLSTGTFAQIYSREVLFLRNRWQTCLFKKYLFNYENSPQNLLKSKLSNSILIFLCIHCNLHKDEVSVPVFTWLPVRNLREWLKSF